MLIKSEVDPFNEKRRITYYWYSVLYKLCLSFKQSFKFLDTFSFSLENKIMFFIWKGLKIANTVVMFNPVQVVNYPVFRQRLFIYLLPYKNMFKNIPARCSGVFRLIQMYIPVFSFPSTTFPTIVFFPFNRIRCCKINNIAITASFRHSSFSPTYLFATINTIVIPFIFRRAVILVNPRQEQCAGFTPNYSMVAQFATINTRVAMPHAISLGGFRCFCHIYSIPYHGAERKYYV